MSRTPVIPRISVASRVAAVKHLQRGGELPGVQHGTGFFGNLLSGLKTAAVSGLKEIGKAAIPMAKEALAAGLITKGPMKHRLRAAAQSATRRQNLVTLAKAGSRGARGAMIRPF